MGYRERQLFPGRGEENVQNVLFDCEALKAWFLENRRELPWRENPSAYSVWVSEVMLQQTQAAVVQSYYLRWMRTFPSVADLAAAPLEQIIKLWEGLGYYSRARHLHEAARFLVLHNSGSVPSTYEDLIQIKGLGRYTVGAILSFAFKEKRAAVDGNTVRVLTRYYALEGEVQKKGVRDQLWQIAEALLPEKEPWLIVEGLIELGALVCKKEPRCSLCPLRQGCLAYRQDAQTFFPRKAKRQKITSLVRSVFVLTYQGALLIKKGQRGAVMADLYEFPFAEEKGAPPPLTKARHIKDLASVEQHFTRYKGLLYPSLWQLDAKQTLPGHEWVDYVKIDCYPFSSGHRRILQQIKGEHAYFTH